MKYKMTVVSDLKKYAKLNGHSAESYSTTGFLKYLSKRFNFSEYELKQAHRSNKIRIQLGVVIKV